MRVRGVLVLSMALVGMVFAISALSQPGRAPAKSSVPATRTVSQRIPALAAPPRHSLLVVGASYSAALGATSAGDGFAEVLGRNLGWPVDVDAVAGSGYLNPGPNGHSRFGQRIDRLPSSLQPGLVLIQGGRNDAGYGDTRLKAAVCASVSEVRRKFSGAEVALLGNVPFSIPISHAQRLVERDLAAASRTCHAPFIDPIAEHWVNSLNAVQLRGRIPGHPNDAGYAYIARRLAADLATLSDGKIAPTPAGTTEKA